MDSGPPRTVRRLDARSLRALAHPLRVRLLGMLSADGPATATGLAGRVGESSGTTSWHLRLLAEQGLIEEVPDRGNRRERWWRAAQDRTQLDWPEVSGETGSEESAAMRLYLQEVLAADFHRASTFLAEIGSWSGVWRRASSVSNIRLRLTADELRALNEEMVALLDRYDRRERSGDESVIVQWQSFPRRPDEVRAADLATLGEDKR
jgi:DNA-binding transcriptional ArsR family regulator